LARPYAVISSVGSWMYPAPAPQKYQAREAWGHRFETLAGWGVV